MLGLGAMDGALADRLLDAPLTRSSNSCGSSLLLIEQVVHG